MTWLEAYNPLLQKYCKPIIHMRSQNEIRRLGLMLGSGVSKPLGIPNWDGLVNRIAEEIQGEALIASQAQRSSITSKVQMLFEQFRRNEQSAGGTSQGTQDNTAPFADPRTRKRWQEIVRKKLYETVDMTGGKTVRSQHPYLDAYIDVIRNSPMTVNYNFDDFIERMLSEINQEKDRHFTEGYESVWDINLQFKSSSAIIYHPNGYLPREPLEKSSDWLVFSEDEYADQLIYSMTGYFSSLAHHLSKSTCLLIGLSLEDSTLRHLLRQSARINPGHYHYYVAFVQDGQVIDLEEAESIRAANFEVYNLITLFLTNEEIEALGKLITMDKQDFQFHATENKHTIKYCYYVTGAIGAGKSTVVSYFRSLQTYDEWTERRPPELARFSDDLTSEDEEEADNWIAEQFNRKNWNLCMCKDGIHVVDRSPLDPLGFTEETKWPDKARLLLEKICGSHGERKIEPGRVILLIEDPKILCTRIKPVQQEYTPVHLKKQQKRLKKACELSDGVHLVDTRGKTVNQVVKGIARIIHMQEYEPLAKLHERLEEIKNGGHNGQ